MGNTGGVTVGCTVFDFLSGRTARLNDGKGTEPIRPVVAGWQARDCVPVYGHHDSGLCQLGATGVANRVEVSLSSFRQPLVSGCVKTDRSRPAGIPYLNRQCLLPGTAIALLENQPGRPCPNPKLHRGDGAPFMVTHWLAAPPVAAVGANPARKVLWPCSAIGPGGARKQRRL